RSNSRRSKNTVRALMPVELLWTRILRSIRHRLQIGISQLSPHFELAHAQFGRDLSCVAGRRKAHCGVSISPPSPPRSALRPATLRSRNKPALVAGFFIFSANHFKSALFRELKA